MADEPDMLLPIANVGRIMKQILPSNAKISKEAKQSIQECATEFICFVTGEASDKCHKENRKTVNGDDICWALSSLGFDQYSDAVARYLHRYREVERQKAKQSKRTNIRDRDEESNSASCQKEKIPPSDFRFLEGGSCSSLAKPSQHTSESS